jgi:hypothetical protein
VSVKSRTCFRAEEPTDSAAAAKSLDALVAAIFTKLSPSLCWKKNI